MSANRTVAATWLDGEGDYGAKVLTCSSCGDIGVAWGDAATLEAQLDHLRQPCRPVDEQSN